jgi:hypothetical protein
MSVSLFTSLLVLWHYSTLCFLTCHPCQKNFNFIIVKHPWRAGNSRRGESIRKGSRRVNVVEIPCTHVWKWKMRPVETIPGMGVGGREEKIKENDGVSEFNYDI